jgi:Bacteriophage CI repressor helix-turn-helix domain
MTFRERVIEAYGGKSIQEIAESLEENYQTVYGWLVGKRDAPTEILIRIGKQTGASLHWLLTGDGERRSGETFSSKPSIEDLMEEIARRVAREEIEKTLSPGQIESNVSDAKEVKGMVRVPTLILKEEKRKTG